ncbi:putative baseplate assembly protein [Frankia sp. Cas3]|uniref:putative baseplate assembly protein n=1 Tax=Frankia sp. Cas3 TaxID=3073926 RepID=UPI002AD49CF7|nr:putative baseplate assembly protein [Frankia sp. Cas3]
MNRLTRAGCGAACAAAAGCGCGGCGAGACGAGACCAGTARLTPASTVNRAGLDALAYRVGTHGSFLTTMLAALSDHALSDRPDGSDGLDGSAGEARYPLRGLTARRANDPSIALLDAWATVADVLTFYQERIANEGYLRTATERTSVVEIARLVGYRPRPGLGASVYLAYTLDVDAAGDADVVIPAGSRAQSVPGPDELPQVFETMDDMVARAGWNELRTRRTRPPWITFKDAGKRSELYLAGVATGLRPNDPLLLVFGTGAGEQVLRRVLSVTPEPAERRTRVALQTSGDSTGDAREIHTGVDPLTWIGDRLDALGRPPSRQPDHAADLSRSFGATLATRSDAVPKLLAALRPEIGGTVYRAWANAAVAPTPELRSVQALRARAVPFGATAPRKPVLDARGVAIGTEEWPLNGTVVIEVSIRYGTTASDDQTRALTADIRYQDTTRTGVSVDADARLDFPAGAVRITVGSGNSTVTFTFGGTVQRVITVVGPQSVPVSLVAGHGGGPMTVTLDDDRDTEYQPAIGQSVERRLPGHHITVGLEPRPQAEAKLGVLTVRDESLLPPKPPNVLPLDAVYDQVVPGSWVVVERTDRTGTGWPLKTRVTKVETVTKSAFGIAATVTQLTLEQPWLSGEDLLLTAHRNTSVRFRSEPIELAWEPCSADIAGATIELDRLYDGLVPGRHLIVSGERTDIGGTTGVPGSEIVMISGVSQGVADGRPGDTVHTTITLAAPLRYTYRCDTARISGNVVRATHGQSATQVLGSGDASTPFQAFTLRRAPLTYLPSAAASGAQSTLVTRVNGVRWAATDDLMAAGPTDHTYLTRADAGAGQTGPDGTIVLFGDGVHGARPATGQENITATYRVGLGRAGNVDAGLITQLQSRPPRVSTVTNPRPATGGADPDGRDAVRRNAAVGLLALDHLVSVSDYADFARARAGIGKAAATRLSDGRRTVIHVTIAGAENIPIDEDSELFRGLRQALARHGDPAQPTRLAVRDLALILCAANIRVLPDYLWTRVEPAVRAALFDRFSFDRRELGQDVVRSDVIATVQAVPGVDYVDVDVLATVPESITISELNGLAGTLTSPPPARTPPARIRVYPARRRPAQPPATGPGIGVLPAQLAIMSPDAPETLILQEIRS